METDLKRKIRYFFNSPYRRREGIRFAIKELGTHGELALVGGMLRDIALFGNAKFNSDLDFVIDPVDLASFEAEMLSTGARINRFGGYSLPENWGENWKIDVWPLERTWAHVNGHADVHSFADLVNVTFFNCDAIIYAIGHGNLDAGELRFGSEYFLNLDRRILEINLQPNPNPIGNAVRAFRYALSKGFRWGSRLSRFVEGNFSANWWKTLLEAEMRSFQSRYLNEVLIEDLIEKLNVHIKSNADIPFDLSAFRKNVQLNLPINHYGTDAIWTEHQNFETMPIERNSSGQCAPKIY